MARTVMFVLAITSALIAGAGNVHAQADPYPNKPIRMIVPFAPGGASDFVARIIQPDLGSTLGQSIIIDNRAGAAGNVGMEAAATAPPDGYTVFLGNVGVLAINPTVLGSKSRLGPETLVPASLFSDVPDVLIVAVDFPAKTLPDLVAHARKNPGSLSFASPGNGSLNRLEMELFKSAAKLEITHVPYKGGAGPAVRDVVGGHVPMMFTTLASSLALIQGGKVRALAVASEKRVPSLPDVPTMAELGYPEVVGGSWQGLLFPAGTPPEIVTKWHDAIVKVLAEANIRQNLAGGGVESVTSPTAASFGSFIAAEAKRWGAVARSVGATPD